MQRLSKLQVTSLPPFYLPPGCFSSLFFSLTPRKHKVS
ncbi:hypothetical protein PORCRE_1351 [Porphyromonas crevioricanis JCM 15906]|uniref:Uncharacterized protein n=1 Tax=Porphyromonas crevioricanis JCM 15906 TaxID=1305617 RepID=T1CHZ7_9PORP|nr:hypothetical protein PORCRE_1351 [Porphyromonas crevioricanis JCM 15906]